MGYPTRAYRAMDDDQRARLRTDLGYAMVTG
jgi:hypothetical protein